MTCVGDRLLGEREGGREREVREAFVGVLLPYPCTIACEILDIIYKLERWEVY